MAIVKYNQDNITIDGERIATERYVLEHAGAGLANITWAELVTLRSAHNLTPGQMYRITDYVTTTKQSGTSSAEHRFDLIVTALSSDTLSEDAMAVQTGERYTKRIVPSDFTEEGWDISTDNPLEFEFVQYVDDEESVVTYAKDEEDGTIKGDKVVAVEIRGGIPYLFKTDVLNASFADEVDYDDYFVWRDRYELDGVIYDRWNKYDQGEDEIIKGVYLTKVITQGEQEVIVPNTDYFDNSDLSSWKIKYTLDNIYWSEKQVIYLENNGPYVRTPEYDENGHWCYCYTDSEDDDFFFDEEDRAYTDPNPSMGSPLYPGTNAQNTYNEAEDEVDFINDVSEGGKGCIYYMKDENNNEAPYDFKNIRFIRWYVNGSQNNYVSLYGFYALNQYQTNGFLIINYSTSIRYTFNAFTSGAEDSSLNKNNSTCYGNVIKYSYKEGIIPDNVFVGDVNNCLLENSIGNTFLNCEYITLKNSYENIITNCTKDNIVHSHNNTLYMTYKTNITNGGYNNIFRSCEDINIYGNAYRNKILNSSFVNINSGCYDNTISSATQVDFDRNCYNNTVNNGCFKVSIGYSCNFVSVNSNSSYIDVGPVGSSITIGASVKGVKLGIQNSNFTCGSNCSYITTGDYVKDCRMYNNANTINVGNNCSFLYLGNTMRCITIGADCSYITLGRDRNFVKDGVTYYGDSMNYVTIGQGNAMISVYRKVDSRQAYNIKIESGLRDYSAYKYIFVDSANEKQITIYKPSNIEENVIEL